jgi:rhodanese-related sulfurtransferase
VIHTARVAVPSGPVDTVRRVGGVALVVVAAAVLCMSCSTGTVTESSTIVSQEASTLVGPSAFAERIGEPGVVTINVHVPDQGSIAGTDLTIPFDEIATSSALPSDLGTPLAVYCRSGNMSADAVRDLQALGYTDIVELDGGFNAWVAAGRVLEPPAS